MKMEAEKRSYRRARQRPETDEELRDYLRDVFGLYYSKTVTQKGHRSLLEFISDVYFDRVSRALVRAPRGGGKTITFAALYHLNTVFKDDFDIVHIGGTEQQSKLGYAYYAGDPSKEGFTGFLRRPGFEDLVSETQVSKTILTNKSRVEIRTGGSDKSVSGPHPNMLGIDELDHIQLSTLNTALMMPIARGKYKSQVIMGSSQYYYSGTLQTLIESASKRGIEIYEFDLFDIMRSCGRKYPSQCGDCPFYVWNNPFTGEQEELCHGRGAESDGHYSYQDAINKFYDATDKESFALQMLLMRGAEQSLVFPAFDRDIHVKEFPPEGTDLSKGWKCFAGVDLWSRGRIVVIAESPYTLPNGKNIRWVIDFWSDNSCTPSKIKSAALDMREKIRRKYGFNIAPYWMEAAAGDSTEREWRNSGLPARLMAPDKRSIQYGISQLRDAFKDSRHYVSLFIDPSCEQLIDTLVEKYRCKRMPDGTYDRDEPDKIGSDDIDPLRYAYVGGPIAVSHLPDHESQAGWWNLTSFEVVPNKWSPY